MTIEPTIQPLVAADPQVVATLVAGAMLMTEHRHAMNIDPIEYMGLVADADADKAKARAAVIVASLERHGYVIAQMPGAA